MTIRAKALVAAVAVWLLFLNTFLPELYIGSSGINYFADLTHSKWRDVISLVSLGLSFITYLGFSWYFFKTYSWRWLVLVAMGAILIFFGYFIAVPS